MLKSLVNLAILTSIVILSWIGFGIYHNYITSTINPDQNILITPIPAKFDETIIKTIKERDVIEADLSKARDDITKSIQSSQSASTKSVPNISTGSPTPTVTKPLVPLPSPTPNLSNSGIPPTTNDDQL